MPVADTDAARRAEISHLADALNERLIAIRRDIHAHPEIGHHEHRTTALIVDELERAGLVAKVLPIGTGAYCDVLPGGYDDSSGLQERRLRLAEPWSLPRVRPRRAHRDTHRRRHHVVSASGP